MSLHVPPHFLKCLKRLYFYKHSSFTEEFTTVKSTIHHGIGKEISEVETIRTRYACNIIAEQMKVAVSVKYIVSQREEIVEVKSPNESTYFVKLSSDAGSMCSCSFHKTMWLPCRHVFSARNFLQLPLFHASMVPERWFKQYQLCVNGSSYEIADNHENNHELYIFSFIKKALSTTTISQGQKFKKMLSLCHKLAAVASQSGMPEFRKKYADVENILQCWEQNVSVMLTVANDLTTSDMGSDNATLGITMKSLLMMILVMATTASMVTLVLYLTILNDTDIKPSHVDVKGQPGYDLDNGDVDIHLDIDIDSQTSQCHTHGYADSHGNVDYKPSHGNVDHQPNHGSDDYQPSHGSDDHQHSHGSIDRQPSHGSVDRQPSHGSVDHQPSHGSVDHQPSHGSDDNQPSHGSVDPQPSYGSVDHQPSHGSDDYQPSHGSVDPQPSHGSVDHQPSHSYNDSHGNVDYPPSYGNVDCHPVDSDIKSKPTDVKCLDNSQPVHVDHSQPAHVHGDINNCSAKVCAATFAMIYTFFCVGRCKK